MTTDFFSPPIHRYTRAQALADGVLIDVSTPARAWGFVYPVALSARVWDLVTAIPAAYAWQDSAGRLADVLGMARYRIQGYRGDASTLCFTLRLPTQPPDEAASLYVTLKIVVGPGDDGAPVLTILLPDED